jgi:hypothetical protein
MRQELLSYQDGKDPVAVRLGASNQASNPIGKNSRALLVLELVEVDSGSTTSARVAF